MSLCLEHNWAEKYVRKKGINIRDLWAFVRAGGTDSAQEKRVRVWPLPADMHGKVLHDYA